MMAITNEPSRVVLICDPGQIQDQVSTALGSQAEFQLADILNTRDRLVREVRAAEPEIIIVDHQLGGEPTLDIIEDMVLQFPEVVVVAILPGEDSTRAQQVMLVGARGFIYQPFTQINLLNTLRRMHDLASRQVHSKMDKLSSAADTQRPVRFITVYSPRGGVGTSSIAANLAVALYEETESKVLLLEGKLFYGHLDLLMNIRHQNTIADLIPHATSLDQVLIKEVVTRHASGVDILLAPSNIQVAQGIHPDALYNVLVGVQALYDYIVVDAGSSISENTVTLLDMADRILLVTNPELASLHDASTFIQLARSLSYPSDKVLIVLNRAKIIGGIKSQDIESAMHQELFAQIPNDEANMLRCLNRGIPLILRHSRSPAASAIRRMAVGLIGLNVKGEAKSHESASDKSQRDLLMASSRLG